MVTTLHCRRSDLAVAPAQDHTHDRRLAIVTCHSLRSTRDHRRLVVFSQSQSRRADRGFACRRLVRLACHAFSSELRRGTKGGTDASRPRSAVVYCEGMESTPGRSSAISDTQLPSGVSPGSQDRHEIPRPDARTSCIVDGVVFHGDSVRAEPRAQGFCGSRISRRCVTSSRQLLAKLSSLRSR
jgi:hypothetical protein